MKSAAIHLYLFVAHWSAVAGHDEVLADTTGFHCINISASQTKSFTEGSNDTDSHFHCVPCLISQNCVAGNQCRVGSQGSTCEKCARGSDSMEGYIRVGNSCTECPTFPWPLLAFLVYVVMVAVAMLLSGFSDSVFTKVKLLCDFLQLLLLTFHIKVVWPDLLLQAMSSINFATFNSNMAMPECLLTGLPAPGPHLLAWGTSFLVPTVTFILWLFLDHSLKHVVLKGDQSKDRQQKHANRRLVLRRCMYLVIIVMYMPVALSSIHSFLCSDSVPVELVQDHSRDVFLLDNTVTCDGFVFQTVHFVGVFFLIGMILLFPLLLVFFTLRQRKWDLLEEQRSLYGPAYEEYKPRFCFWGAVPLLRKLVCVLVTDSYPISAFQQSIAQLSLSSLYLLAVAGFRPYRPCYWSLPWFDNHVVFEVVSNMGLCIAQTLALLITLDMHVDELEMVVLCWVPGVLVLWLILLLASRCEANGPGAVSLVVRFESGTGDESDRKGKTKKPRRFFRSNKVGPDPEQMMEIENRKKMIDDF